MEKIGMVKGLATVIYGVTDLDKAKAGATVAAPVQAVGEGIKVATVTDPFGNRIGPIENPHCALPAPPFL